MNQTPSFISALSLHEIFVFGSNLLGRHAGGAARQAVVSFGAVSGQGEGLQGQSYAIPSLDKPGGRVLTAEEMQPYVDRLVAFAQTHPELHFFVTEIGCGIAGRTPQEIAPLFSDAMNLPNVSLPERFWHVLT